MIRRELLFPDKEKEKKEQDKKKKEHEKKEHEKRKFLHPLRAARGSFTELSALKHLEGNSTSKQLLQSTQPQRSLSSGHSPRSRLLRLPESYPTRVEAYELINECGQGATAKVWRAICKPLNEECAVKIVDLESAGKNLDTIIHEAKLLCNLRHPNVLTMLACFVENSNLWMVLPYIPGGSLESVMNYSSPKGLEERVIAPVMLRVLMALDYLHKQSIVHRDVKASNILLERDNVVLGDFGIAVYMERKMDHCSKSEFARYLSRSTFVGTPVWMAPEIIEQECGHGMKADIYSFGMTILELAIGKAPFAGMPFEVVAMNKLHHPSPSLPSNFEGRHFSADMQDVVSLCLEKDPSKRPTASQLLKHRFFKYTRAVRDAIEELLTGVPGPVKRLTSLTRRSREATCTDEDFSPMAADERISLATLKSKDALQSTQGFDAESALALLHRMLQSTGVIINANSGSPESLNSTLPITPKSNGSTPRKSSFTKRKSSFARGDQWPNLPPAALKHCSGILFASGGRKGFGLQTTWGRGFIMARSPCGKDTSGKDMSCWSGPCYVYLSGTMHIGMGENTRESIVLYANNDPLKKLTDEEVYKMSGLKFHDAVEDNLDSSTICSILGTEASHCHGVAFRHYTGTKAWKQHGIVHVDNAANERVYGRPVSAEEILKCKRKPPSAFNPLIEVLISCEEGRYERIASSDGDSDGGLLSQLSGGRISASGESKHFLPVLKSLPHSASSQGLDTAYSGSFSSSFGGSPAGLQTAPAGPELFMLAVPEDETLREPTEPSCGLPLRHSASAPMLLKDVAEARRAAGLESSPSGEDGEDSQPMPPRSAFSQDEPPACVSSHTSQGSSRNDSALDLAALDLGSLGRTTCEQADSAEASEGGEAARGASPPPEFPFLEPLNPFAAAALSSMGSPFAESIQADIEPTRSGPTGKAGRPDTDWRPPRPPRQPSVGPREAQTSPR